VLDLLEHSQDRQCEPGEHVSAMEAILLAEHGNRARLVMEYLAIGVQLVWIVDPATLTVRVTRQHAVRRQRSRYIPHTS